MKRFEIRLLFRILVTLATLAWFFSSVRPGSLLARLAGVRWWVAVPAFLVNAGWIFPSALRWRGIARLSGYGLTFMASLRYRVIGSFFNVFLPTGNGGDIVRGFLASRELGYPLGGILGTVLVDRIIGMMVSLGILIVAGFVLFSRALLPGNVLVSAAVLFLCASAAVLVLASKKFRKAVKPLLEKSPLRSFHGGARNAARVVDACWENPRGLGTAVLLSLANQLITIASGYLTSLAIPDFNAPFYVFLLVMPLSFIAVLLPSIGGYGVREAGFVLFFGWFGVPAEPVVVFGIIRMLFLWLFALIGGCVFISGGRIRMKDIIPPDMKWIQ